MSWWCPNCSKLTTEHAELHGHGVCETSSRWHPWRHESSDAYGIMAQCVKQVYEMELSREAWRETHPESPLPELVQTEAQRRLDEQQLTARIARESQEQAEYPDEWLV